MVRGSAGTAAAARGRGVSFGTTETHEFQVECLIPGSSAEHRAEKLGNTPHQPRIPGGSGDPEVEQRWAIHYARKLALELGTLTATSQSSSSSLSSAAAAASRQKLGPDRWIMDTGSGYDLIGREDVPFPQWNEPAVEGLELHTANGLTQVNEAAGLQVQHLGVHEVKPLILESCPPVLTVGRRCLDEGYSFNWPAFGKPTLTRPDGKVIELEVEGYVPYLVESFGRRPCLKSKGGERSSACPAGPAQEDGEEEGPTAEEEEQNSQDFDEQPADEEPPQPAEAGGPEDKADKKRSQPGDKNTELDREASETESPSEWRKVGRRKRSRRANGDAKTDKDSEPAKIAPAVPNVMVLRSDHWEEDMLEFQRAMSRDDPWGEQGTSREHVQVHAPSPCVVVTRGSASSSSSRRSSPAKALPRPR